MTKTDLTYLAKLAAKSKNTYTCTPKGKGTAKLLLKEAVGTKSFMDSYADYRSYAVPFMGTIDADSGKRLGMFFANARTTNGMAGVGGSWTVDGIDLEAKVVNITVRYSIPD